MFLREEVHCWARGDWEAMVGGRPNPETSVALRGPSRARSPQRDCPNAPGKAPNHIHTTLRWGRPPGKPSSQHAGEKRGVAGLLLGRTRGLGGDGWGATQPGGLCGPQRTLEGPQSTAGLCRTPHPVPKC